MHKRNETFRKRTRTSSKGIKTKKTSENPMVLLIVISFELLIKLLTK